MLLDYVLADAAQHTSYLFCCKSALLAHICLTVSVDAPLQLPATHSLQSCNLGSQFAACANMELLD